MSKFDEEGNQYLIGEGKYTDYWSDDGLLGEALLKGYFLARPKTKPPKNDPLFRAFEAACLHREKPLVYAESAANGFLLILDLSLLHTFLTDEGVLRFVHICVEYSGVDGQLYVAAPELPLYGFSGIPSQQIETCLQQVVAMICNPQWYVPTCSDHSPSQKSSRLK